MNEPNLHLIDGQFDDLLLGEAEPAVSAHLDACAECQARQQVFTASLESFNAASLAWSQARSHTHTRDLPAATSARRFVLPASAWALATVLLVAIALFFGVARFLGPSLSKRLSNTAVPASAHQQEIASDNAMLADIDAALERDATPVELFGTPDPHTAAPR